MKLRRRQFLQLAAGASILPTLSRTVSGQTYPARPITMIVPFPAGGSYDALGRVLVERLRGSLGQSIVIENVTGAGGSIGVGRVARANPDGYTIVLSGMSPHVLNQALYSLSYNVLNDFTAISPVATTSFLLYAKHTVPANDLHELIAWLKTHPDMTTAAVELATVHLVTASFEKQTGTRLVIVHYRGAAPAMQDLVAGHVDLFFDTPLALPLARTGSIKAFATTSDQRLPQASNTPTFAEMGLPAVSFSAWLGVFAPKGIPREIIDKLNTAIVGALSDPSVRSRLADIGYEVFPRERQTPETLGAMQRADAEKWWPLVKEFGIKAE